MCFGLLIINICERAWVAVLDLRNHCTITWLYAAWESSLIPFTPLDWHVIASQMLKLTYENWTCYSFPSKIRLRDSRFAAMPIKDRERAKLAREWGITLRDWHERPKYFKKLFDSVRALGNTTYPFYDDTEGNDREGARDYRDHDSRHVVKDLGIAEKRARERVRSLTSDVRFLRDHIYDKGEMDWRTRIEKPLFERFDKDVLW